MANNSSNLPGMENFPIYITYFVGGTIIGGSNLMIFLSIIRYEALRTNKIYVIIMAQSFADAINMLGFTIGGIRRSMLIFSGQHNTMYSVLQCAQVPHTIIWSVTLILANVMLAVVSIDRLLCIRNPLCYMGWSYKYTLALAGSAYVYSIVSGAIGLTWAYTTNDQSKSIPAPCIAHQVMGKVHQFYDFHFNEAPIFWASLSVIIYLVVWVGYKRQNSQISPENQGQQQQIEQQRKFTKSLAMSCLCTFFLFIIPWQLGTIAIKLGHSSLALAMWTSSNLNPFANVIIYVKRHEEIRQALKGLFRCKDMPIDIQMWKANNAATKTKTLANVQPPVLYNNFNHISLKLN